MKGYVFFVTVTKLKMKKISQIVRPIIRDVFFSKIGIKIPDLKSLSHDTLSSLDLMNSSDYLINCRLVFFIPQCFELRNKLISMNG